MRALFTTDGTLKWAIAVNGSIKTSPTVNVPLQVVYFGADDGMVYAVNESNGQFFWSIPFATGGAVTSSPALCPGTQGGPAILFIGSSNGNLYPLDPATGLLQFSPFHTGGSIRSSPIVDGAGNIIFGSDDLKIYSLNAVDGFSINWTFSTSGSLASSAAIAADGTVYMGSDDQNFYAIR
jgi:outer membrane protein assembly factor BamB